MGTGILQNFTLTVVLELGYMEQKMIPGLVQILTVTQVSSDGRDSAMNNNSRFSLKIESILFPDKLDMKENYDFTTLLLRGKMCHKLKQRQHQGQGKEIMSFFFLLIRAKWTFQTGSQLHKLGKYIFRTLNFQIIQICKLLEKLIVVGGQQLVPGC